MTAHALHECRAVKCDYAASFAFPPIVGYQEIAVPQGSSMRTATFKALSGNYKISAIQVKGALGGGTDYASKMALQA